MKSYFISLLCVSIASALSLYLLAGSFALPSVKTVCSLCILLSIIKILSPLFDTITELAFVSFEESTETSIEDYNDEMINETGKYICRYTKQMLSSRYGISPSEFSVSAEMELDDELNASLSKIVIEFTATPSLNTSEMILFIEENLLCKCVLITP